MIRKTSLQMTYEWFSKESNYSKEFTIKGNKEAMDYEDYEEANYWFSIFSIIDIINRYGYLEVMRDLDFAMKARHKNDVEQLSPNEEPSMP